MKQLYKNRLKKLADHLLSGKLGHKKFDFSSWNRTEDYDGGEPYKCGYAGCAIGECPIVFKRDWEFGPKGNPSLKGMRNLYAAKAGEFYFGIDGFAFNHLFVPNLQRPDRYGGRRLGDKAKAPSVAKNILTFLKMVDNKGVNHVG